MNTFNENNVNRRGKAGLPGNKGEFAVKPHDEASGDVVLGIPSDPRFLSEDTRDRINTSDYGPEDFRELTDAFTTKLKNRVGGVDLAFVDYNDSLRDDQVDTYLAGGSDELREELIDFDSYGEQMHDRAIEIAKETCQDLGVEWESLDFSDQDELRMVVSEHDESDVVGDLVKNSRTQLMRQMLVGESDFLPSGKSGRSLEEKYWDSMKILAQASCFTGSSERPENVIKARVELTEKALRDKGIISGPLDEANREKLTEAFENGPEWLHEAVSVDAIWNGDIREVNLPTDAPDRDQDEVLREVEAPTGLNIVVLDRENGSGWEAKLDVPMRMRLTRDNPAHTDSAGPGYGWDEVVGVVHSAYDTDLEEVAKDQELASF